LISLALLSVKAIRKCSSIYNVREKNKHYLNVMAFPVIPQDVSHCRYCHLETKRGK
jgi:hypothetical protein